MRALIVFLIGILSVAAEANDELARFNDDGEKAVFCFAAHTLRMQLHGAFGAEPAEASKLMASAQRWQTVLEGQASNPMDQYQQLQEANQVLGRRVQAASGNSQESMAQAIAPIATECDALLARLDAPATPEAEAQSRAKSQSQSELSVEDAAPVETEEVDADVFAGLLQAPVRGDFRWNPHSTLYATVKTKGTFQSVGGSPGSFRLTFDSKITTLCVGELMETSRSQEGYLMHLTVKPGTGQGCEPTVTRGVLFPFAFDNQRSSRQLMLRLYDAQDRLITASRFKSKVIEGKNLDQQKLLSILDVLRDMEENNDTKRRDDKLANLKQEPGYSRLKPFYESCMNKAPSIYGVVEPSYYCICMTYKFGVGGRIPESEFVSYTEDFTRLTDRFEVYTDDNKLYTRLAETCQSCSNSSRTLHPGCDEPDGQLLRPQNFAELIQQLDKPAVRLESSTFYRENFFVIYLQGFSDDCETQIEDPVAFDYVVTEHTTDPYAGTFSNEVQRSRTYVSRKHATRYQAIYDKHRNMSPNQFWGSVRQMAVTSEAELRRSQSDLNSRIRREAEKRASVREHLAQGCQSDSVQRVYRQLDQLF